MNLDLLTAISPIDGRYRGKTEPLADYFSEYALIRYRVRVEIEYFITLCELPLPQLKDFDHALFETLRGIYLNFNEENAQRVKDIEKVTNHDVKAVEYTRTAGIADTPWQGDNGIRIPPYRAVAPAQGVPHDSKVRWCYGQLQCPSRGISPV